MSNEKEGTEVKVGQVWEQPGEAHISERTQWEITSAELVETGGMVVTCRIVNGTDTCLTSGATMLHCHWKLIKDVEL